MSGVARINRRWTALALVVVLWIPSGCSSDAEKLDSRLGDIDESLVDEDYSGAEEQLTDLIEAAETSDLSPRRRRAIVRAAKQLLRRLPDESPNQEPEEPASEEPEPESPEQSESEESEPEPDPEPSETPEETVTPDENEGGDDGDLDDGDVEGEDG